MGLTVSGERNCSLGSVEVGHAEEAEFRDASNWPKYLPTFNLPPD